MKHFILSLNLFFIAFFPPTLHAETAHVAVASNFSSTLKEIARIFTRKTPHHLMISKGSTGKFYAQIINGAPFDLFLAADEKRPMQLETSGWAVENSRFTYATGCLALWSPQADLVDNKGAVLKTGHFRHLAMANPRTAPYGLATRQLLIKMKLWDQIQRRVAVGENVAQAFHYIQSGNAELGFISCSQLLEQKRKNPDKSGSSWLVPPNQHEPLLQQAVLLRHGKENSAARDFLDFLQQPGPREIIRQNGYLN